MVDILFVSLEKGNSVCKRKRIEFTDEEEETDSLGGPRVSGIDSRDDRKAFTSERASIDLDVSVGRPNPSLVAKT
jgi:hypothetical protein